MPQFGSEPKFEPELFRTGPRFGPKFNEITEPDLKSSPRFNRAPENANPFERVRTSGNRSQKCTHAYDVSQVFQICSTNLGLAPESSTITVPISMPWAPQNLSSPEHYRI